MSTETTVDQRESTEPDKAAALRPATSRRLLITYLLAVVSGCLLLAMWQVDGVLQQMLAASGVAGSAQGFPLPLSGSQPPSALRNAWTAYQQAAETTALVAPPRTLLTHLFFLDLAFLGSYSVLLGFGLSTLYRKLEPTSASSSDDFVRGRQRLILAGLVLLVPLAVVDLAEDGLLGLAYIGNQTWLDGIGPWVTLIKLVLGAIVLAALVVAVIAWVASMRDLKKALAEIRAVLVAVVPAVVLLLVLPIGVDQIDDVVRAWTWSSIVIAVVATVVAAYVVRGAVRRLTIVEPENLHPEEGDSAQAPLLAAALAVLAVGILLHAVGWGWGLIIPGGLLLLVFLVGCAVEPPDHTFPGRFRGWVLDRIARLRRPRRPRRPRPTDAEPDEDEDEDEDEDDRTAREHVCCLLGRVLAATLCTVVVWVMARAATFELLVRVLADHRAIWAVELAVGALVLVAAGWLLLSGRLEAAGPPSLPFIIAFLLMVMLWSSDFSDGVAIDVAPVVGTVGVLMMGVAAAAGVLAGIVVFVRRSSVKGLKLAPAIRLLRLRRFPVVAFVVVWALIVALLDAGGFHDIRTQSDQGGSPRGPAPAPSLEEAYDAWLRAGPADPEATRPLVVVAAQGGGIRAAVWTALVMECLFGPTPLGVDSQTDQNAASVCAEQGRFDSGSAQAAVTTKTLPVFLASGASGGSVGLAAWSARRVDLGVLTEKPLRSVEDVLPADYVAPDLARLLTGDALYLLLAHHLADRAAILEQSWETSWGTAGEGLRRGLRATWRWADQPPGKDQWWIPVLALNGTQVEDGCRFVAAPVDFVVSRQPGDAAAAVTGSADQPDDIVCGPKTDTDRSGGVVDVLPRTTELVDYLCPGVDVPLSTAAHLSARFPYVSPTARVHHDACSPSAGLLPDGSVSYVIDGGYFDNSGSATALQAWQGLQPLAAARERSGGACVVPIFLQIDNGVADLAVSAPAGPPLEALAPASALLTAQQNNESLHRDEARRAFATTRSASGRALLENGAVVTDPAWFQIAPAPQPGFDPPLGWALSAQTVQDMRTQLLSDRNRATITRLRGLLSAATCSR